MYCASESCPHFCRIARALSSCSSSNWSYTGSIRSACTFCEIARKTTNDVDRMPTIASSTHTYSEYRSRTLGCAGEDISHPANSSDQAAPALQLLTQMTDVHIQKSV